MAPCLCKTSAVASVIWFQLAQIATPENTQQSGINWLKPTWPKGQLEPVSPYGSCRRALRSSHSAPVQTAPQCSADSSGNTRTSCARTTSPHLPLFVCIYVLAKTESAMWPVNPTWVLTTISHCQTLVICMQPNGAVLIKAGITSFSLNRI